MTASRGDEREYGGQARIVDLMRRTLVVLVSQSLFNCVKISFRRKLLRLEAGTRKSVFGALCTASSVAWSALSLPAMPLSCRLKCELDDMHLLSGLYLRIELRVCKINHNKNISQYS